MTDIDYIALSIPIFFLLIGVEVWYARAHGQKLYRLNDAINDLNCGILQQVLGVFTKTFVFGAYVLLYSHTAQWQIPSSSVLAWVLCFLGVDFFYYWFHRVSHECNLPWGAHIVHHSSEEYNLAVALRQGAFQPLFSWIFYLPLAILGFPPLMFLACTSFNTLYQFWIHTRAIGRLGAFEWLFNTPSHHRVHHGCDDKYLDKNYGGTLIIWDRLFGSFQAEEEEPTYGITKPLASWNPLWANLHYYEDLRQLSRQAPNFWKSVELWFRPPSWKPDWATTDLRKAHGKTPLTHGEAGKFDARAPRALVSYILLQFLGLLAMTVFLLDAKTALTLAEKAAIGLLVAWTAANLGALFERKKRALGSELSRLAALWFATLYALFSRSSLGFDSPLPASIEPSLITVTSALACGGMAAWLLKQRTTLVH